MNRYLLLAILLLVCFLPLPNQYSVTLSQKETLLNAVVVNASPSQINEISSMDFVKRIDRVIRHKITSVANVTNIEVIKADQVWFIEKDGTAITGEGISVGVLDTGIN